MPVALCASPTGKRLLVTALLACLAFGCVGRELRAMETARTEYEQCVSEYSESDPECRRLHDVLRNAQNRYEHNSRRAWSCDPISEDCPTRR